MRTLGIVIILVSSALMWSFSRSTDYYVCPKSLRDSVFVRGDVISLPSIYFNIGRCTLAPDKDSFLNQTDSLRIVVKFINEHPRYLFEVRNHTDTVNPYSSTRYTMCRAESVLKQLIDLGADKNRITAHGMGDTEPLILSQTIRLPSGDSVTSGAVLTHRFIATKSANKNDWSYLRQKNRRTDLKIVRTDYVPQADTAK